MLKRYKLSGVCAQYVDVDVNEEGIIEEVVFTGGCDGNLKAISKLVKGRPAQEVADVLRGNQCGMRGTSCADRFSTILESEIQDTSTSDTKNTVDSEA